MEKNIPTTGDFRVRGVVSQKATLYPRRIKLLSTGRASLIRFRLQKMHPVKFSRILAALLILASFGIQ